MCLDECGVERRPLGMTDLGLLPVSLLLYFLLAQSVFVSENYHYQHFCEKNGYMTEGECREMCWRMGGNSWREMEGRLKLGTFFMTSMWQRLLLPPFMRTRWLNY